MKLSRQQVLASLAGLVAVGAMGYLLVATRPQPRTESEKPTSREQNNERAQTEPVDAPAGRRPVGKPPAAGSSPDAPTGDTSSGTGSTSSPSPQLPVVRAREYTISYSDSGYSPASITVKAGDRVTFINNSARQMWPASNAHPTHNIYPEFDAGQPVAKGSKWSFTFTRPGSWGYHDHLSPSAVGVISVQ